MERPMVVQVMYPWYAAGLKGTIIAREKKSGRWLVKLAENHE